MGDMWKVMINGVEVGLLSEERREEWVREMDRRLDGRWKKNWRGWYCGEWEIWMERVWLM